MGAISQFVLRMAHESPELMLMASMDAPPPVPLRAGLGAAGRPTEDASELVPLTAVARPASVLAAADAWRRLVLFASATWPAVSG